MFEKIWQRHVVVDRPDGYTLLYVDRPPDARRLLAGLHAPQGTRHGLRRADPRRRRRPITT
jgi:3-isopropylmalate/(R)-2-methylmalate dehydratase large subunit